MPPPPIPKKVDFRIFYGRSQGGIRVISGKIIQEKAIDAHKQARDWINENLHHDIISISNGDPSGGDSINITTVTVWFRES